ncbi:MAG TPA: hypothetical protein DEA96_05720, partial [Leptospiraceae bacterium]|nr:hypothetical protein [Leptospiraceae bacterium]
MKAITDYERLKSVVRARLRSMSETGEKSYALQAKELGISKTHLYSIAIDAKRSVDAETLFKI